jgi:replicative DNA helicase
MFVDYAKLIRVRVAQEKRAAVEEVSQSMKELARELNVPVVLLAQLKRDADNRRPELSDFQWTSQFEQDADVAALIHHKYDKEKRYKIERSYLLLEKVRDGKRCIVNIVFQPEFLRMIDDEEHGVTDDL